VDGSRGVAHATSRLYEIIDEHHNVISNVTMESILADFHENT